MCCSTTRLEMNILCKWSKWKAPFCSEKVFRAIRNAPLEKWRRRGGGRSFGWCMVIFFGNHTPNSKNLERAWNILLSCPQCPDSMFAPGFCNKVYLVCENFFLLCMNLFKCICLVWILFCFLPITTPPPPPPPPCAFSGCKRPTRPCTSQNKHGGDENSMDCGEAFIRGLVVSQTIQKQLQWLPGKVFS